MTDEILEGAPEAEVEVEAEVEAEAETETEAVEGDDRSDWSEIEVDGEVWLAPPVLKSAFLRQADYTRKTQELAERRRAA
ncbi:MAG: hypothetical protein IM665_14825, partial [Phenylobacterium sp.]|nr:hypothetical protein [Phenylobacterium sp.]